MSTGAVRLPDPFWNRFGSDRGCAIIVETPSSATGRLLRVLDFRILSHAGQSDAKRQKLRIRSAT